MTRWLGRASAAGLLLTLVACGGGRPDEASLRDSFVEQIRSVGFVRTFERKGDEVLFSGPYAGEADVQWRVRIDSVLIEPNTDESQPFKGTVKSSWFVDGKPIEPRGSQSDLPSDFLDKGIGQECWAFWEVSDSRWSWT
jgi:hypothetical protein